eukprot:SAG22_NODE_294_length_12872_cov_47.391372_2_plen_229_part_00
MGSAEIVIGRALDIRAVQADGAHMMADALFVVVAWFALHLARRGWGGRVVGPAGQGGGPLAELVGLSLNLSCITVLLAFIGGGAAAELLSRDGGQPEAAPGVMLLLGLASFSVQLVNASALHALVAKSPGARGVFLHSVLDCFSSGGVVIAALSAQVFATARADAAASLFIAALGGLGVCKVLFGNLALLCTDNEPGVRTVGWTIGVACAVGVGLAGHAGQASSLDGS